MTLHNMCIAIDCTVVKDDCDDWEEEFATSELSKWLEVAAIGVDEMNP